MYIYIYTCIYNIHIYNIYIIYIIYIERDRHREREIYIYIYIYINAVDKKKDYSMNLLKVIMLLLLVSQLSPLYI